MIQAVTWPAKHQYRAVTGCDIEPDKPPVITGPALGCYRVVIRPGKNLANKAPIYDCYKTSIKPDKSLIHRLLLIWRNSGSRLVTIDRYLVIIAPS